MTARDLLRKAAGAGATALAACSPQAAQLSSPPTSRVAHGPEQTDEASDASTTTEAPTTTTTLRVEMAPTTSPTTVRQQVVWPEEDEDDPWGNDAYRERILACIRSYEGEYGTETGNGHHGAYQFVQSTFDGAVERAGYPEYVGERAGDTPPHVQDAAAWQLYQERGFQPWPPATRYCSA